MGRGKGIWDSITGDGQRRLLEARNTGALTHYEFMEQLSMKNCHAFEIHYRLSA